MDETYLNARITATKAAIEAYESAELALVSGGQQAYKVDTGQNVISVTKFDLPAIGKALSSLYNLLTTLEARLNGNQTMGVPGW